MTFLAKFNISCHTHFAVLLSADSVYPHQIFNLPHVCIRHWPVSSCIEPCLCVCDGFFWPFLALFVSTAEGLDRKQGKRRGVTRSCRASAHGPRALPTKLCGTRMRWILRHPGTEWQPILIRKHFRFKAWRTMTESGGTELPAECNRTRNLCQQNNCWSGPKHRFKWDAIFGKLDTEFDGGKKKESGAEWHSCGQQSAFDLSPGSRSTANA